MYVVVDGGDIRASSFFTVAWRVATVIVFEAAAATAMIVVVTAATTLIVGMVTLGVFSRISAVAIITCGLIGIVLLWHELVVWANVIFIPFVPLWLCDDFLPLRLILLRYVCQDELIVHWRAVLSQFFWQVCATPRLQKLCILVICHVADHWSPYLRTTAMYASLKQEHLCVGRDDRALDQILHLFVRAIIKGDFIAWLISTLLVLTTRYNRISNAGFRSYTKIGLRFIHLLNPRSTQDPVASCIRVGSDYRRPMIVRGRVFRVFRVFHLIVLVLRWLRNLFNLWATCFRLPQLFTRWRITGWDHHILAIILLRGILLWRIVACL